MTERTVLRKDQLEISLHNEKKLIQEGTIKDDNPLDLSEPFRELCEACRKGDLKVCQEKITEGVNVNARDPYDYTPLILASLCGHYEVAQLLLESGALCERDTFQGERCLYNALNDRIRNLLLEYDYSKSTDPLQPLAAHVSSLLTRDQPGTSDIVVTAGDESLYLHKFILAARSPYFRGKLVADPKSTTWKLPSTIPPQAFGTAIKYLYFGEAPRDLRSGPGTGFTESEVFAGIDRIAKHLEIPSLLDSILDSGDRRLARQRRSMELSRGRDQLEEWFRKNVLGSKIEVDSSKVDEVRWDRHNGIFADVVLRADELPEDEDDIGDGSNLNGKQQDRRSVLFPCHRAMLLRSEFFQAMFSSTFREAHLKEHLNVIPVDCSPEVLEIVLTFLYTERADFPLDIAVDVLFAADMLFIEKLKTKAAVVISTLGSGDMSQAEAARTRGTKEEDEIDIYAIIRAAWLTRVQRLEEFAARYLAYRLEAHIDSPEFAELIQESAARIRARQETDSIELLDDIRFYLGERFRLRFDDAGLEEMMEEEQRQQLADAGGVDKDLVEITDKVDTMSIQSQTLPIGAEAEVAPGERTREQGPITRTLDGEIAGDEFSKDAINYQILMEKLDRLLEELNLEA
ncbi:ankyrin repeat and BTB/POZ domain protein [Aspergillus fischeri NRRL 181]|uniref:Ankyrin repeat and BTB/POZ domain protein n=1 Tax=Neosartorya fischeri (strain ATCC 1020 / DSM 3700 / CBS 544.65 / FGSC A1164 / JCM 1740 / NRRL 181 / WB 181) TaxID=331117 RepID=A1DL90_NEOFI|nr:ankyrin repeat and BTB/POZ domain protein [Aspergillus fischeri NRRL 181]EAW15561.1 ankyrin repeat and BTB/POZ domain protein [Aspergillus fischeri NRRL 181]